ncbi:MAG: glycoside hydrolase family 31 protein [Chryseolinea sp.]
MTSRLKSATANSLGNLKEWSAESFGLEGKTDCGNFRVLVYNPNIIRVIASQDDSFEDFSYAVVASPESSNFIISDHANSIEIRTTELLLSVSKSPVRFTFKTLDNRIINEDETEFGISWIGDQVTNYKKLQEGERFVGLGEKTGPLDRRGAGYQNWNTDAFAYSPGADPLYSSIPFYMGIHHHMNYGIFFDNSHKSFFNFGASNNRFSSFAADAGEMNYYFIYDHSVADIIKHYTHLTGRMELPPRWSIGYQQCRYSYYPDKEVLTLARTFRDKDIPADAIVLDIHYMDQYKIFSWSKKDFPDPKRLIDQLKSMGFQIVIMCDPGIKIEQGYQAYEDGIRDDVFIKYPDGAPYSGQVWPGWCHFPDFTNPKTRQWWQEQFKETVSLGVEGFWNDMNEIATWGQMIPENIEMDFEGEKASMRRGRNLYGYQMARATYEGTKALLKGRRPFNLTRSGYAGVQRYSAVWTGDNVAYDEHMMLGVRIVSSMGMSGIAFAGYDIGGFVGDTSSRLFARWISIGTFAPFFRGHSMINSRDCEPWSFGEEVEQIARNYIKFRYQLLPYIYALFYHASETGMPVQRSLAIDYPHNHKVFEGQYQNQYLFGPYFLIAPVESDKDYVKVYFPEGDWFYLYNGQHYAGNTEVIIECPLKRLPVFVKSGAIVPMQHVASNTNQKQDTLILHIYLGHDGSFLYYDDDGSTFDYQGGEYAKRIITLSQLHNTLTLEPAHGTYQSKVNMLKVVFHGMAPQVDEVQTGGAKLMLTKERNSYFAALEKFDPFYDPEPAPSEDVASVTIPYTPNEVTLTW